MTQEQLSSTVDKGDLRYANLIEALPGYHVLLKADPPKFTILAMSDLHLGLAGSTRAEITGKGLFEVFPAGTGEPEATGEKSLRTSFQKVLKEKKKDVLEGQRYDVADATGNFIERYWKAENHPVFGSNGQVDYILHSSVDITETLKSQKNAERLQVLEGDYQLFLQAPIIIAIVKVKDLIIDFANERFLKFWGKANDIIGTKIDSAIPELTEHGLLDGLNEVVQTGNPWVAEELPLQFKIDDSLRFLNFSFHPFFTDKSDRPAAIFIVINDVTGQVEARISGEEVKERLNFRNALLEAQNETTPDGVLVVNAKGEVILYNQKFIDIWKFPITEAALLNDKIAVEYASTQVADPDSFIKKIKALYNSGVGPSSEEIILKDGRIIERHGSPILAENGLRYGWAWYFRDITELKSSSDQLQRKVEERTRELQVLNTQLKRSNDELEQYAYVSSHDLQEPLRKIHYFNDQLQIAIGVDSPLLKYTTKIQDAAKRMSGLIHSLLEYSRTTRKVSVYERTDLNTILNNVLMDYDLLIEQKGAILEKDQLSVIDAVPLQMNQLFFNLIGNALKFTRKNVPPVIRISETEVSDADRERFPEIGSGEYIKLVISDNGIGFTQDYADKIFVIFQRLNDRSLYGGYGIGLALCKKLVEGHNGFIYATGEPKNGASFSIILPRRQL